MTVVINEFETLGEAPPAATAGSGTPPEVAERAQRRRARLAACRHIRMART
ncbi:MAG: hypothetical protein QNJ15_04620 [Erythrobacter sp.]|nr:hypothetical protein [Erythrobacter sp.]